MSPIFTNDQQVNIPLWFIYTDKFYSAVVGEKGSWLWL
jgi:hypothetical protein